MEVALLLGVMMILLAYGVPIAFSIGISSSVFLMVTQMKPLILIAQRTVLGTDSFPLLAIPLFTLGGYLMESSGLSKRLVGCIEKLLGGAREASGLLPSSAVRFSRPSPAQALQRLRRLGLSCCPQC